MKQLIFIILSVGLYTTAFAQSDRSRELSLVEVFSSFKAAGMKFKTLKSELTDMQYPLSNGRSQIEIKKEIDEQRILMFQYLEQLLSSRNRAHGLKCDLSSKFDKYSKNILAITFSDEEREITFNYNRNAIQDFEVGQNRFGDNAETYHLFLGQFRQYAESIVFSSGGQVALIDLQYVGHDSARNGHVRVQTVHCGIDVFDDTDTP